jgi:signal transduction histidine kinase
VSHDFADLLALILDFADLLTRVHDFADLLTRVHDFADLLTLVHDFADLSREKDVYYDNYADLLTHVLREGCGL